MPLAGLAVVPCGTLTLSTSILTLWDEPATVANCPIASRIDRNSIGLPRRKQRRPEPASKAFSVRRGCAARRVLPGEQRLPGIVAAVWSMSATGTCNPWPALLTSTSMRPWASIEAAGDEPLHLLAHGDVVGHGERVQSLGEPRHQHDLGAPLRQQAPARGTDARRRTDDDTDRSVDVHRHTVFCTSVQAPRTGGKPCRGQWFTPMTQPIGRRSVRFVNSRDDDEQ